jgi:hypothetical protein
MLSIKRCRAKTRKPESFLSKLFDILNNTNNNSAISWDSEGKKIVISDIVKLCNEVLPKFYKHKNYSSFIRQLNLYGFHKTRGILDNSEKYEHEKFTKNITKEEIKQISKVARHKHMIKSLDTFINSNNKDEETKDNDLVVVPNDKVLNYLTKKIDENEENTTETKKEIEELKAEIIKVKNELVEYKSIVNNNQIIIAKLIKIHFNIKLDNQKLKKINNIQELFKRYLCHLKIYSVFVNIDSNPLIIQKEKSKIKINTKENFDFHKYINSSIDPNISKEVDDLSLLNDGNNSQLFDLNLLNLNYSNSFINNSFNK